MTRASWLPGDLDITIPQALLTSLTCALLVILVVLASVSTTVFGLYNPSWEGTNDFREQIDESESTLETVSDASEYSGLEPNGTVAFVIAPDEEYKDEEAEQIRQFTDRGGTLVVFENFETSGNALLSDLDSEARLDGQLLRDEEHYFRGPAMPVATTVENHSITTAVDQLTLNHATAVEPGNATVLVQTSEFAYLVDAPDEELDDEDELGTYPVATIESVGDGDVIVVGDPSITINAMLQEPDNAIFLEQIYNDADHVIIDISHNAGIPPLTKMVLVVRETPIVQVLLGGLVILGIIGASRGLLHRLREQVAGTPGIQRIQQRFGSRSTSDNQVMTPDERAAYLQRQHPDWDDERIERILTAFNRSNKEE